MKTADASLASLINSGVFVMADLYTITLKTSNSVLRYTAADKDITFGGNTFLCNGPLIKRGRTRTTIGITVDELDVTMVANSSHTVNGVPFIHACVSGALDGADLMLQRAFAPTWASPVTGAITLFTGRVMPPTAWRTEARLKVKSDTEILSTPMPRNLYEAACNLTVYGSQCAVNKVAFTVTGTVSASSADYGSAQTALSHAAGWFNKGVLTWTSGQNAGLKRTVKLFSTGKFTFAFPLPYKPAPGDGFSVFPGCDQTLATCVAKFNNKARFRGTPFIPVPETSI